MLALWARYQVLAVGLATKPSQSSIVGEDAGHGGRDGDGIPLWPALRAAG